ncbi:MAG TPA: 30S ribosomal protein S1 [Thermomicrobiales bacterium]|nr:30S ribosomal protein S1 [Thermomicrobiales bacterium]
MEDRATRMDGAETMPGTPPLQSEQRDEGAPVAQPIAEAAPTAGADGEVSLMQQLLDDPSHDYRALKYGDVLDGVIMQRDRDEFLIDIGSKSEGIIPSREYSTLTSDEVAQLKVGDQVLVFVVQPENQEGHTVLSIDKARQEKSWRVLQEHYDKNEVIQAQVTNYNKGGLLVNLDGVRGFVPASQVTEIRGGDDASKQADMARLVGQVLPLKVIEINRHRNRLILSERMAVQERRDAMKEKLIENLHEGETKRGRVSSIADFGAFVDIGGADGLVHLSEISWSRVKHPSEVLKVGDEVDVYVLNVNPQEKKIALSIKRTQPEPWSRVAQKYEIGQIVPATITQLANFGAFARIEDGIEGLIHVSELSDERVNHPREVVQEGQEVQVRIIRIDPQRRRMGLSLRRAADGGGFDAAFAVSPRREAGPVGLEPGGESGAGGNPDHEPTTPAP